MSSRCATSALHSDEPRERAMSEWEAYKNCSDYGSHGNRNGPCTYVFFIDIYVTTWPSKARSALLKKDLSLSKRHASLSLLPTGAVAVQHRQRRDWNHLGADETRCLSWILYGAHGSGRQTESSRYELCSQTIIAFSLVLFISVSAFRQRAAVEAGKESGTCNHTLTAQSFLLFLLEGAGPMMLALGWSLVRPFLFLWDGRVLSPAAVSIRSSGGHLHLLSVYHLLPKAFSTSGDV